MRTAVIKLHGHEREVEYKDYGYEHDTNAHVIDWNFIGDDAHLNGTLSDAEEQTVFDQLYTLQASGHGEI